MFEYLISFVILILIHFKPVDMFLESLESMVYWEDNPNDWNITFNLFLSNNPNKQIVFNFTAKDDSLKWSGFDPSHKTKIVIHGFNSGLYKLSMFNRQWMLDIKDYAMEHGKYNVICVDWSLLASGYDYFGLLSKLPPIGQMVANFTNRLNILTKSSNKDMHCIGHSLGAHICGYAGETFEIDNKLGQITGLDPAGPGFDSYLDILNWPGLNRMDAYLVLIIHTSAGFTSSDEISLTGFVGNANPLGHYDFRVNGGGVQPMCHQWGKATDAFSSLWNFEFGKAFEDITEVGICGHESSYIYPIAEPQNGCQFIAYKCPNYDDFEGGKCAEEGLPLGFNFEFYDNPDYSLNQTKRPNDMFIKTSDTYPFCLFHYQILVKTEALSISETIILSFFGLKTVDIKTKIESYNGTDIHYILHTDGQELGTVTEVKYESKRVIITEITVNFMSHIDKSIREEKSFKPNVINRTIIAKNWFDWFEN